MRQLRRVSQHAVLYARVRQDSLGSWIGARLGDGYTFEVDNDRARFTLSSRRGKLTARCRLIASVAGSPPAVVWAYAPMFAAYSAVTELGDRIREFGEFNGVDEFTTPELAVDAANLQDASQPLDEVAHLVGSAAIEMFGAQRHYYVVPSGQSSLVYLLDEWSDPPPDVDLGWLQLKLASAAFDCDDLTWSMDGLVRLLPGWTLEACEPREAGASSWRMADPDGRSMIVRARADEAGRIADVAVSGIDEV